MLGYLCTSFFYKFSTQSDSERILKIGQYLVKLWTRVLCLVFLTHGVVQVAELVDKFCYLGDMLSVDGDADAAVEARIRIGWNKFRQLAPLLTNKDVSLIEWKVVQ